MWWFLAGDGIALQCIATTTAAATASLPPLAVQNSEGRGGTLLWRQEEGDSEYRENLHLESRAFDYARIFTDGLHRSTHTELQTKEEKGE
ncbi:hypothetical protein EJB05_19985, partial [Eragrostis curvula]